MLSCEKVIQGLWEYLDHELDKANLTDFQKHVDLCRSCFSRIEFEKLLRDHMKTKTDHVCPEEVKKKISNLLDLY